MEQPIPFPALRADDWLLTREEAAEALAVSVRSLDELRATGRLPCVRVTPAMVRFRWSDLMAFIAGLERG